MRLRLGLSIIYSLLRLELFRFQQASFNVRFWEAAMQHSTFAGTAAKGRWVFRGKQRSGLCCACSKVSAECQGGQVFSAERAVSQVMTLTTDSLFLAVRGMRT